MTNKSFVHLHTHSTFSLLDGASKVEDLVSAAVKDGQSALATTEHGNMYGVIPFYKECKKQGIKFIPGMEAYMANETRFERLPTKNKKVDDTGGETEAGTKQYYHLTLLTETNKGYQNLIRLSSEAYLSGFYRKPRVDWELLDQYSDGLIAASGCLGGHVLQRLLKGDYPGALKNAGRLQDIFGRDNFFIELQNHGLPEQIKTNPQLIQISKDLNAPLIATQDCHYTHKGDSYSHSCLLAVQTGSVMSDKNRFKFEGTEHYFKSAQEMRYLFRELPQACNNTLWIAERSNVEIEFGNLKLPKFPVPKEYVSDKEYLKYLVYEGVKDRWSNLTDEITSRIDYELSVIDQLGYNSYFLILWDLVKFAIREDIPHGPGRGSSASSVVLYCLKVTEIDPLRYNLVFERFLNLERSNAADVDWDISPTYRDKVIQYTSEKYGKENVAQVITFSTIKARAAVRDAARVLEKGYGLGDKIAKAIPPLVMGRDTSLYHSMNKEYGYEAGYNAAEEIRTLYKDNDAREVINVALGMEGLCRQYSVHAAATIISDKPLTAYIPVQNDKDGHLITQYEAHAVEDLGLLKMDFLGLKNLDVIDQAVKLIGSDLDINKIDLTDQKTIDLLARGDTIGVFQLEGVKMRALERLLAPNRFEDVAALIALYRPGPMATNMHLDYANRKNGRQETTTFHPDADEILGTTYGLMIYQEQMMQIARKFAGYTLGEADLLRKACGHKVREEMAIHREKFIQGCIDQGYGAELGKQIFDIIEPFADYSFCAIHSFSYSFIAFQTAYLKANYPTEYFSALLSNVSDLSKAATYITDAKARGVHVLVPDVNSSIESFNPESKDIRFGLTTIKNVGESASLITAARDSGKFTSFEDFCNRVDNKVLNKRTLESLIMAGGFDCFGLSRKGLLEVFPKVVKVAKKKKEKESNGEMSLFDDPLSVDIPNIKLSKEDRLKYEREMLGLYLTDHPLSGTEKSLAKKTSTSIEEALEFTEELIETLGGVITNLDVKKTRKGKDMAIFTLSDMTSSIEVVMFPKSYETYGDILLEDRIVLVHGRINIRDDDLNIIVEEMDIFDPVEEIKPLRIEVEDLTNKQIESLKSCINMHLGESSVLITVQDETLKLPNDYNVSNEAALVHELKVCLGPDAIIR